MMRLLESPSQLDTLRRGQLVILREIVEHPELSYKQIASRFSVSRHTVVRIAREAHIIGKRGRKLIRGLLVPN